MKTLTSNGFSKNEKADALTLALLQVREKKQLTQVVTNQLKALLGYTDSAIFWGQKDGSTLVNLLSDPSAIDPASGFLPVVDATIFSVKTSDPYLPAIRDLKPYVVQAHNQPQPYGLELTFNDGKNEVGWWVMLYGEKEKIQQVSLEMLTSLAPLVAAAVENSLDYEQFLKLERENEIIQSLSSDFAAIRDKKDLLKIIHFKLKNLFDFSDQYVAIINEDALTTLSFLQEVRPNTKAHVLYQQSVNTNYPLLDGILDKVLALTEPQVFNLDQHAEKGYPTEYFQIMHESGVKTVILAGLQLRERVMGLWCICQLQHQEITTNQLHLIKKISSQLSIAVSNIRANEEIQRREHEKSLLLSFSNALASVRTRKELSDAFSEEISKFEIIQDYSLRVLTEDKKHHQMFLYDANAPFVKHPDFPIIRDTLDDVADGVTDVVIQSDKPVTFNVAELNQRDDVPPYIKFWKDLGLVENKGMPIRVGDETIGILWLRLYPNYDETPNSLLQNICFQIAVALSNILANEKVVQREEEKTILLSLSNDIASLKNRDDLFKVVNARIKHIFSITQFGIVKINEDGLTHSAFMMDLGDVVTHQGKFKEVTSLTTYSIRDTAFSRTLASEDPVLLDVDELAKASDVPAYVHFWQAVGFKRLLSLALRVGGQPIGAIFFNIEPNEINSSKNSLLKGICAQLAVAVSNILANEKVLHQLHEINQYKQQLEEEKIYLKEEIAITHNYTEIIGESRAIKHVFQLIEQIAFSDSTVLLLGETGTGKELIARAIHNHSSRKDRLMVKVNCATLPANLIESELFGHERGSFTGATEKRVGKFELADNGTLFLDEIGEMPLDLQVKLLRALQEKEIERIGGNHTIKVNVRIIAATNRDLEKEMNEGRFRRDLYYRLNIFPISLPPLRSRPEDIPLLVTHFIQRLSKKAGRKITKVSSSALQELLRYTWPGNIRELEHLIERSLLLSTGDTIKRFELPSRKPDESVKSIGKPILLKTIDENERDHILSVLNYCNGRISGEGAAAEILGVPKSTLNSKIKRLGIIRKHIKE